MYIAFGNPIGIRKRTAVQSDSICGRLDAWYRSVAYKPELFDIRVEKWVLPTRLDGVLHAD